MIRPAGPAPTMITWPKYQFQQPAIVIRAALLTWKFCLILSAIFTRLVHLPFCFDVKVTDA